MGVLAALGALDRVGPGLEILGVPGERETGWCGMDGVAHGSGSTAPVVVYFSGSDIAELNTGSVGDGRGRRLSIGAGLRADGEMGESHQVLELDGGTLLLDRISDRGGYRGGSAPRSHSKLAKRPRRGGLKGQFALVRL